MAILNESAIKEKLRENPVGVYLIYGEEDYLKKVYAEKIVAKCVDKDFADFNLHIFEGTDTDLSAVYDATQGVPMMSDTNCVFVKDMPFESFGDADLKTLDTVITECPETCGLVFLMQSAVSGAKWNKVVKLFEAKADVVLLNKKTPAELVKMLESGAKKRNAPFEPGVANYLLTCVGNDLNTLLNETDKVCAYAAGRTVKKTDIDTVCIKTLESKVFDITKALLSGRLGAALQSLNNLVMQREDMIMVMGALISAYVDIYRARSAVKAGKRAEYIAEFYDYRNKTFRLTNAARDGASMSVQDIYESIEVLAWADAQLKSSSSDVHALIVEQTLVKLAMLRN